MEPLYATTITITNDGHVKQQLPFLVVQLSDRAGHFFPKGKKILKKVYSLLVFHAADTFSIQNSFQNRERHHGKILVIVKLFVVNEKAPSYIYNLSK